MNLNLLNFKSRVQPLNVLLIGNNPMEMGTILDKLNKVRSRKIVTEIAFDLQTILQRLVRFNPNYILIDDNIGKSELRETVDKLSHFSKTKNTPVAVLKNSNYNESFGSSLILDYLLKENLSADSLYNTLKNALRIRKTQHYLAQAYKKRKKLLSTVN